LLVEAQVCRLVVVVRALPIQLVPELLGKVSLVAQASVQTLIPQAAAAVPVALVGLQVKQMAQTLEPGGGLAVLVWRHPSLAPPPITVAAAVVVFTVCPPTKPSRAL
jgi:protein involved in polysaccharide export with SLBB domain